MITAEDAFAPRDRPGAQHLRLASLFHHAAPAQMAAVTALHSKLEPRGAAQQSLAVSSLLSAPTPTITVDSAFAMLGRPGVLLPDLASRFHHAVPPTTIVADA